MKNVEANKNKRTHLAIIRQDSRPPTEKKMKKDKKDKKDKKERAESADPSADPSAVVSADPSAVVSADPSAVVSADVEMQAADESTSAQPGGM